MCRSCCCLEVVWRDRWCHRGTTKQESDQFNRWAGSAQEREAFTRAVKNISRRTTEETATATTRVVDKPVTQIEISIKLEKTPVRGQDVGMLVTVTNKSEIEKHLKLHASAQSMWYNGLPGSCFWKEEANIQLGAFKEKDFSYHFPYSQCEEHLTESNLIKITVTATEEERGEVFFAEKDIYVSNPSISIEAPDEVEQYEPAMAQVFFSNPLSVPLNNCILTVGGSGLVSEELTVNAGRIEPGAQGRLNVDFIPFKTGDRQLQVNFDCDKFKHVKGFRKITILPSSLEESFSSMIYWH